MFKFLKHHIIGATNLFGPGYVEPPLVSHVRRGDNAEYTERIIMRSVADQLDFREGHRVIVLRDMAER